MRIPVLTIVLAVLLSACGVNTSNHAPSDSGTAGSEDSGSSPDIGAQVDGGSGADGGSAGDSGSVADMDGFDLGSTDDDMSTTDSATSCSDTEVRLGERSCGLNDRGVYEEVCTMGVWQTGDCVDPDECTDGDTRQGATPCGILDSGRLVQTCIAGAFEDASTCEGAYVCAPGETTMSSATCGDFMDGRVLQECDAAGLMLTPLPDTCVFPGLTVPDMGQTPGTGYLGTPMAISGDGRFVVVGVGTNNASVLLHDRHAGVTEAVNVTPAGVIGDRVYSAEVSDDGRYAALETYRFETLWGSDNNGSDQVWLRDRTMGTTVRVSQGLSGEGGNDHSKLLHLSPDGERVLFRSMADNLVPGDTNSAADLFLYRAASGVVERVSTTSNGDEVDGSVDTSAGISDDGRTLAFSGSATNLPAGSAWVKDLVTGAVTALTVPEPVNLVRLSGDGNVVFYSQPGAIWVWDRAANQHYELPSIDSLPLDLSREGRVFVVLEDLADPDAVAVRWTPVSAGNATVQKRVLTVDLQGNALGSSGWGAKVSADGNYGFFESSVGLLPGHTYGSVYVSYIGDL